jgi:hypothetical protein
MSMAGCGPILTLLFASASTLEFPIARAKDEFVKLLPHVEGYCGVVRGNVEAFRRAVLPFGPMDLYVAKGTAEEKSLIRNLYLGVVGGACGVDAASLSKSFSCGGECVEARRSELIAKLPQIKSLVKTFRSLRGIDLVSQWGIVGEYRINNVFTIMGQTHETEQSTVMGFVPSETWTPLTNPSQYLRRRGIPEVMFANFLRKVKDLSLAAVVREQRAIRVVRVGIADKESGLLFLFGSAVTSPAVGDTTADGRSYVVVKEVEPRVVFYETK